jgi:hypothetical protein
VDFVCFLAVSALLSFALLLLSTCDAFQRFADLLEILDCLAFSNFLIAYAMLLFCGLTWLKIEK